MNIVLSDTSGAPILSVNRNNITPQDLMQQCAYRGYLLDNVLIENLHFKDFNLQGLIARGAKFVGCTFKGVSLRGAKLSNAVFLNCSLDRIDVKDCDLNGATYPSSTLGVFHPNAISK
jgi:uncharacterized protein YjbI with pentapeptide repeats